MRDFQSELMLQLPAGLNSDPAKTKRLRKHMLNKGRPRRLPVSFSAMSEDDWGYVVDCLVNGYLPEEACHGFGVYPVTIKVSIDPASLDRLDRIRVKLAGNCTQPDIIRIAVEEFIHRKEHRPSRERIKRHSSKHRQTYVRVPFDGLTAAAIGEAEELDRKTGEVKKEATGLCAVYKCIRQQVISMAVEDFLERMR